MQQRDGFDLRVSPPHVAMKTKILVRCRCGNNFAKSFMCIVLRGGGFCRVCTNAKRIVKSRETCMKNRVEHPMQSEDVQAKHRETCMKNRGVEYPMQSEEVKAKSRGTWMENRGVENPMQSEEVQAKSRETCMKNRGVENPMQSEDVQAKSRETCMKNRGVEGKVPRDVDG